MNKLLWMQCFVRSVETGSFSAVARELGIGQPNVSRYIAALEEDLGARLLLRSTRKLTPTAEGQHYYGQARHALDLIAQAESDARSQDSPRGLLRVACAPGLGVEQLMGMVPDFMARYPEVELELRLSDELIDLVAGGVDVAIRGGQLKDSALRARRVGTSERICVASPAYLAAHGAPGQPGDLAQHQCIVYTLLNRGNAWPFRDGEVQVHGRLRVDSLEAIRRAAIDGLGIGYLPRWMVITALNGGTLVTVLDAFAAGPSPINAVYAAERLLARRAAVFIDFIAERFGQTPGLNGAPATAAPH
ncbi:MAG: LysR family transcriptional regulator [Massilia sp.]